MITPEHPDIIDMIVTHVTREGEVMVTMPSGRVSFMGFWAATKFVIQAMRRGFKVKVDD